GVERGGDTVRVVVGAGAAAPQDDVAVRVAGGGHDRAAAARVHAEEGVRAGCGPAGVHGDLDVAVGAVLEAHGHAEAAAELAVHLAFRGARTDRSPGHRVRDVLRGDRVEEFGAGGHAQGADVEQQFACGPQAPVDV